jgi:hypothetical protein
MTAVLSVRRGSALLWWAAAAVLTALLLSAPPAWSARVTIEDSAAGGEPKPVGDDARSERIIVGPEPRGSDGREVYWRTAGTPPLVRVWVDRGEWSTYLPGDRLEVNFRVDRPCYVTILDYSPDGRVDIVYPNRWSGSNFALPGRTYRVPESRSYSLRIAGAEGVETLVACAHEVPWPMGPYGAWLPSYRIEPWHDRGAPRDGHGGARGGGTVIVGGPREGGGQRDRVVVAPEVGWSVPPEWRESPGRWSCASVSFYVEGERRWRRWRTDTRFHEAFAMRRGGDVYYRDVYYGNRAALLAIECMESYEGRPTMIVGSLTWEDGWSRETIFVIDVEGERGDRPREGRKYKLRDGPLKVDIKITDVDIRRGSRHYEKSIGLIRFDVKVRGR